MASNNALRSCASKLLASSASKPANRGFHSTAATRVAASHHEEPFYVHSKRMYNQDRMSHQALKMNLLVWSLFSFGVGAPIFAVVFQQNKAKSS